MEFSLKRIDLLESLSNAVSRLLMLDYDGTLAPFQANREKAFPYPGVRQRLDAIMESGNTRLVLVSGRQVKDLIPLLGLRRIPEVWGSHGWERRWPDGRIQIWKADERALQGLAEADRRIDQEGLARYCEVKPASLALHWRGLPESTKSAIRAEALKDWKIIAVDYGLEIRNFDGGLELRAKGRNKGVVVETLLSECPEGTFAAYLGDDFTDEDAFEAIKGRGIGILVGEKRRPTKARIHIRPPEQLVEFLEYWQGAGVRWPE